MADPGRLGGGGGGTPHPSEVSLFLVVSLNFYGPAFSRTLYLDLPLEKFLEPP